MRRWEVSRSHKLHSNPAGLAVMARTYLIDIITAVDVELVPPSPRALQRHAQLLLKLFLLRVVIGVTAGVAAAVAAIARLAARGPRHALHLVHLFSDGLGLFDRSLVEPACVKSWQAIAVFTGQACVRG